MTPKGVRRLSQLPREVLSRTNPRLATWNRIAAEHPELRLDPFSGDDLSFFLVNPNAELSLQAYRAVTKMLAGHNFLAAAKGLIKFRKRCAFTFCSSGWVPITVSRIILEDEEAARAFVKQYWTRSRPAVQEGRALDALSVVGGEHQMHWIKATLWFVNFCRSFDVRKSKNRFVVEAVCKYWEIQKPCLSCLDPGATISIAQEVFDDPEAQPHNTKDRALARHFEISHSTLIRVRARLKARNRPQG